MEVGIFSKTWDKPLEEVLKSMKDLNVFHTQFNLSSAGLATMPDTVDYEKIKWIHHLCKKYEIHLVALSGTFNMIDSDYQAREKGIEQFDVLCQIAKELDIPIITLCTGSKNPDSKWKWHPDNDSKEAFDDLIETTNRILISAKKYGIVLGVETEVSNIINSPKRARRYLDMFKSPYLKIVMDGANLFLPEQIQDMGAVLEEAFHYLGDDIVLAHAKDLGKSSDIEFVAAGEGVLDYDTYIALLKEYNYVGPIIMHGLSVEQIPKSLKFLKEKL